MGLTYEVAAVFEEQPRKVFNIWEIAKLIASKRMRFYEYGWLMRWFARKHPQAAEELMRDMVYDQLKDFNILDVPGVDFATPPPRLHSVPSSEEPINMSQSMIEAEVRSFIRAQRGKPYSREDVVRGVAYQRLDAMLHTSQCAEYCGDHNKWISREENVVSGELRDSSYEKTFG